MGERRCRRCGSRLASDHQDDEWCSPCLLTRRGYRPRDDPHFAEAVLALLCSHPHELIDVVPALGLDCDDRKAVVDAVRSLRRKGHVITSTDRTPGYCYMGFVERGGFAFTQTAGNFVTCSATAAG